MLGGHPQRRAERRLRRDYLIVPLVPHRPHRGVRAAHTGRMHHVQHQHVLHLHAWRPASAACMRGGGAHEHAGALGDALERRMHAGGGGRTSTPARSAMSQAASAMRLSGTSLRPRMAPLAVSSTRARQSTTRPASASAEKPPNTTVCTAPMRAHASCMHACPVAR